MVVGEKERTNDSQLRTAPIRMTTMLRKELRAEAATVEENAMK